MGVVQTKCGRGQNFSRALCALFSFGPSNLMYVPTPMLIATPDHGYFWIGVGKGGGDSLWHLGEELVRDCAK